MAYPRLDSHGLSTMLTRLASVIRQGHTIKSDDATMTQRKNLKIIGATVTDNALADQTEVRFPNGGHTIISSSMLPIGGSTLPMAGRDNLQFGSEYDPVFTEDDATNNKTIVHGQLFICDSESDWKTLSDETFKAKYGADREQVGVYWYRPWANSIAYQTDLTPVGAVLSYAVDTTNTTIFPADLVEFPNKDYVICRGATVKITDYPLLYDYFEAEYGDGNYFGNSQTAEGYFVLPNWSADFPTNGVLVIKARVTSDVITFAEVDETGESARTDEVPSCARVAALETVGASETITQNNYTVKYIIRNKLVQLFVYRNESVSTDVDINITLPFTSKMKVAVPAYVCQNKSFIEVAENFASMRIVHKVGDGWFQASAMFFIV